MRCLQNPLSAHRSRTYTPRILNQLTLGLNLNQLHARILRAASVHSVLEVAEPRGRAFAPDLFDARVGVGGDDGLARHGDPVLVAGVGEGNAGLGLALLEVGEFLAVRVGQEEEVRSRAFGDGHGAGDGLGRAVLVDDFGLIGYVTGGVCCWRELTPMPGR